MIKDADGKVLTVGIRVVRAIPYNQHGSCTLEVRSVERIKDGKVYLNGSNTPIKRPESLAVIN
jgi:hypothetical protein